MQYILIIDLVRPRFIQLKMFLKIAAYRSRLLLCVCDN